MRHIPLTAVLALLSVPLAPLSAAELKIMPDEVTNLILEQLRDVRSPTVNNTY